MIIKELASRIADIFQNVFSAKKKIFEIFLTNALTLCENYEYFLINIVK